MVRRSALVALLLLLLSAASVAAAAKSVSIYNYGFTPTLTKGKIGMGVAFHNSTAATLHSTTSNLLNLWSDDVAPGTTTTVLYWHAGSFAYHCRIHPFMTGTVKVKPTASPLSGSTSTTFTISPSALAMVSGYTEDIQKRRAGGTWQTWQSTSGTSVKFQPTKSGTYEFRARERRTSDNVATPWSPLISISVL